MKNKLLTNTSYTMIIFAISMIFAHMLVSHTHYVDCHESNIKNNISHFDNISFSETASHHGHSHCIITDIAYYQNHTQPILADAFIFVSQNFEYTYLLINSDENTDYEYHNVKSEKIILKRYSKGLSFRAPPIVA